MYNMGNLIKIATVALPAQPDKVVLYDTIYKLVIQTLCQSHAKTNIYKVPENSSIQSKSLEKIGQLMCTNICEFHTHLRLFHLISHATRAARYNFLLAYRVILCIL